MENLNLFHRNFKVGMFYVKRFMEEVIVLDLTLIHPTWNRIVKIKGLGLRILDIANLCILKNWQAIGKMDFLFGQLVKF